MRAPTERKPSMAVWMGAHRARGLSVLRWAANPDSSKRFPSGGEHRSADDVLRPAELVVTRQPQSRAGTRIKTPRVISACVSFRSSSRVLPDRAQLA